MRRSGTVKSTVPLDVSILPLSFNRRDREYRDRVDESPSVIETKRISRSRRAKFRISSCGGKHGAVGSRVLILRVEVRLQTPPSGSYLEEVSLRISEENLPLEGIGSECPCRASSADAANDTLMARARHIRVP